MRWRTPLILLEVVLAIAFVVVLLTAAGLWRLTQGPVSVSFATPYVSRVLGEIPSVTVEVSDTVLIWSGWRRPVEIRAVGVSARGKEGRLIAAIPELSIRFSIRALFAGRLEPTSLDVHRLMVRLVRKEDGQLEIGLGDREGAPAADETGPIVNLLTGPLDRSKPLGYLRRVRLVDANVTVDDRHLGMSWGAPAFSTVLRRHDRGISASFDLRAELKNQTPRLRGNAHYFVDTKRVELDAEISELWPSRLAVKASELERLRYADFPVNGRIQATLDTKGAVHAAKVSLKGGAGRVEIPGLYKKPIEVRSLALDADMSGSMDKFVLKRFEADLGGPVLGGQGVVTLAENTASIDGQVTLRNVQISKLSRHWPATAAPAAREWVAKNLTAGVVNGAKAFIAARVDRSTGDTKLDRLEGTVELEDATVHYFRPLPPITNISATARFGPDSLTFDVTGGKVNGLQVRNGKINLTELGGKLEKLAVVVDIDGPTRDALAILDNPRLQYISRAGIDGSLAKGTVNATLDVRLPLLADLTLDKVTIDADAHLQDLDQPEVAPGIDLAGGSMNVKVDTAHMVAVGEGRLKGLPSTYELEVRFDDIKEYAVKGKVITEVTPADIKRTLGVDIDAFVEGAMDLDLRLVQRTGRPFEVAGKLALDNVKLAIPMMAWTKPPGRPGSGSFLISMGSGTPRVERFGIRTGELQADGKMEFHPGKGWAFHRATVDHFVLGNNDLRADVVLRDEGGFDITVDGRLLDGEKLIDLVKKSGGADDDESGIPPIALKARFDEVVLGPGRVVQDVSGEAQYDGEYLRRIHMGSQLSPKHTLIFDMRARGKERSVLVTSDDAGTALKRLDIVRNVQGGDLRLTMTRPLGNKDETWVGQARIDGFAILNAPALAELMTSASLTAINRSLAGGKGIGGNRAEADFTFLNGKITVKKARSVGSQLGFTVENGEIDMERDYMYLKGTIVPAYTINKFLGDIPVIGRLFTGVEDSGVFAVSYRVRGSFDDPKIRVNPLTAFVPGFLRNMVDVLEYGKADESSPTEGISE